ncbi:LA2681 family HEPN domain-containing protein [Acidovorax sp. D2M1]|uniref:LA2681 family HEPN domain-containing protein n=1 Tax=Acidovorax benzenivorans TaxID=2987520 RepID=A0ABT5RYY8_9BURK|nr:LA2681 family HEPN domain-containing protein [Acidovorax benzenivorans]MDD2178312.1 LA2681 family HEPN domain-containing protein [Acidovorax benzenivorans]
MSSMLDRFYERSAHLIALLNSNPAEAVKQAREINLDLDTDERFNLMGLRAAILVDGGTLTHQQDAIEEGLALFRELHSSFPIADVTYNLANGLVAATGFPPRNANWLNHQELTRERRAEARRCFWKVAQDPDADSALRTQAWTNLANQFSGSYRLGEAHDGWLAALEIDPENGVAASSAARSLLWLYERGGCSELTRVEAILLAKIADRHRDRVIQYAGVQAAEQIAAFASKLGDAPPRSPHQDPFIRWVERERLTLAPVVELIDPNLGKLDWLMLPGILERESVAVGMPLPVFAMFNMLKSDFILARDLLWRASDENAWPATGRFGDTLDYATYGPDASALILAHRTALDLLDKIAVTANHYFELGQSPDKVYFGKLWRGKPDKTTGAHPLAEEVEKAIRGGASALYGLVELAEDYDNSAGILRSQKHLRNAGTHRFVVLHDIGDPANSRQAPEIEHHRREPFTQEVLRALRVARSAIQMLALSISQHEQGLAQRAGGLVGSLIVPDHDWIRGRDDET